MGECVLEPPEAPPEGRRRLGSPRATPPDRSARPLDSPAGSEKEAIRRLRGSTVG